MDEVEVNKNVEELKEEGRQEAREIAKKVAATIPEGMTLRRIREHNYNNCFVIETGEETLIRSRWDGTIEKIREEIEKMVQKATSNLKQSEKEEELQKIYPLPPEPVVEKPVPVPVPVPVVEKTEEEIEIERLEQIKIEDKDVSALARELGLQEQVKIRDTNIEDINLKIDVLRHGGRLRYRDPREWEEYEKDVYEEYEEETGGYVGTWTEYQIKEYDRRIPLSVLKVLEKHMQKAFFASYEIWEGPRLSMLIGVKGNYVAELARWG